MKDICLLFFKREARKQLSSWRLSAANISPFTRSPSKASWLNYSVRCIEEEVELRKLNRKHKY